MASVLYNPDACRAYLACLNELHSFSTQRQWISNLSHMCGNLLLKHCYRKINEFYVQLRQ